VNVRLVITVVVIGLATAGCHGKTDVTTASASAPPWASADAQPPPPRPGMVWIPKGTLIVGTPPDKTPRVADAEMEGEQIVVGGYYIDVYPYPNEAGAIPKTNVTRDEAKALCEADDKRLCTEIEIERACKGPENTVYPYGDHYRADVCATGPKHALSPNGLNASCVSPFGVADTHGSVWVWTASDWGRGTEGLVTLRGGNGPYGEIVGRCANGRGEKPTARLPDVGVRCCAGPENAFQVVLSVERGEPLKYRINDKEMAKRFEDAIHGMKALVEGSLPPGEPANDVTPRPSVQSPSAFDVERTWTWHPIGNEELVIGGGCAGSGRKKECGVLVARSTDKGLAPLAFVSSEKWQPTIGTSDTPREIYIHGGDDNGAFRKRLAYEWGKMAVGEKQRKKKKGRHYYFD
jgi:formylglycine-generating enzyme required for sulfatase activity